MAKIAFLGLGKMGSGMAARLVEAGHDVTVYNRTKSRTNILVAMGATAADTPREAAQNAEAVFSMVGDDAASRAMWTGPDGVLAADTAENALAVECSTLSHDWVLDLAEQANAAGFKYIDCPVTGWPQFAARGELVLFVGSDADGVEALRPFAKPLAKEIVHFGPIGAGSAYKLIVNLMGSVHIAAAAEGMLVAEAAGLDLDLVAKMLGSGGSGSPQCAHNALKMADESHDEDILFNGHWRLKDTLYGYQFAEKMGQHPGVGAATLSAFNALVERGWGDLAESKVIDALRPKDD